MNLEEFKKALSSDATEENKQLKKQLSELQKEYGSLKESCQALCNRCFAFTKGMTCKLCVLDYPCPHMPNFEEQVKAVQERLKKGEKQC